MAHLRNDEFWLSTGMTANATECFQALEHMKSLGVQFRHLHYGDPTQIPDVMASLQTWIPDETLAMPMVVYTECYDYSDPVSRVAKAVVGLSNIQATDWNALTSFSGA
jgi:hypothetical protein